jgi:hypothetical protein
MYWKPTRDRRHAHLRNEKCHCAQMHRTLANLRVFTTFLLVKPSSRPLLLPTASSALRRSAYGIRRLFGDGLVAGLWLILLFGCFRRAIPRRQWLG